MNYYTFDLDKAKSLLDQSGVTNLEFDFMANPVNDQTNGFASDLSG